MSMEFNKQPFDATSGNGRAVSMAVFFRETNASFATDQQLGSDDFGWKESLETEARDYLDWLEARGPAYRPTATETGARRLAEALMENMDGLQPGEVSARRLLGGTALYREADLLRALAWDGLAVPTREEWDEQISREIREVA